MKQYIADAFADHVFSGNPAAIVPVEAWPSGELMMQIARENNLSETAFLMDLGDRYALRWFTPGGEIDLCGHATLASAYIISRFLKPGCRHAEFETKSGLLKADMIEDRIELTFPAYDLAQVPVTPEMEEALGAKVLEAWMGRDLLCILESEQTVRTLQPDQALIEQLPGLLVHASAAGSEYDCVSRSFAPKCGVAEDPVCGSGHCHIVPYWSEKLGKADIKAYQASPRGGTLYCRKEGDLVVLGGKAALYLEGEITVE